MAVGIERLDARRCVRGLGFSRRYEEEDREECNREPDTDRIA